MISVNFVIKCGANMFYFQAPFGRQEHDKVLLKEFLSESENLNELSCKSLCVWLSDSNIPEIGINTKSKKWERWRARKLTEYNVDFIMPNKGKDKKRKITDSNRRKSIGDLGLESRSHLCDLLTKDTKLKIVSSEKGVSSVEHKEYMSLNINCFPTNDLEFIDEADNGFQETNDSKRDCTVIDKANTILSNTHKKSEQIVSLENQSSFTKQKAISTCSNQLKWNKGLQRVNERAIMIEAGFEEKKAHHKGILSDSVINCKSHSCNSNKILYKTNAEKSASISAKKQHKINSGSPFLSFCSLFSSSRSSSEQIEKNCSRNNEIKLTRKDGTVTIHQNLITANLSWCPLSCEQVKHIPFKVLKGYEKHSGDEDKVIDKSPKPKNVTQFLNVSPTHNFEYFEWKKNSLCFNSDSSLSVTSSEGIAPMASPEVISPLESAISSPKFNGYSNYTDSQELCCTTEIRDFYQGSNFTSPLSFEWTLPAQVKFKLLHEGDVQVCYLSHARTIICKILSSKFLRRWETHHIYLTNDCICSKTPTGFLDSPVPYSDIDDIYVVGRWDQGNRYCIRLVMTTGSLLLQASNSLVRDQWLLSILWKRNMYRQRNILQTSTKPEIILKEIKGLIYSSVNSPLQDDCIKKIPIEIISNSLEEGEIWNDRQRKEEVITALAPLLEDSTPSPEMFQFFSNHCLCYPRSPVIVEIFTTIVYRILKRTVDFGKSPLTRRFVADYLKALHSQNDGDEAIRKFVRSIHGTNTDCPHPRVLPNLVAVSLAAVFSHFEQRKALLVESTNDTNCAQAVELLDKQLECFTTVFLNISEYEDWRPGLAQLLQPIPFPDDALSNDIFIKGFSHVIRKIGIDSRCEVHEMILGIRENKEGWLSVFCPSSLVCTDDGVLWCQMLQTLFNCCCKRRSFLQKMVKHLGALLLVALRDNSVAQEMLCLLLEWRLITGDDQKMQIMTTLQTTEGGRQKYSILCRRQEHLSVLQKEGGPNKLTLPSRSSDADVARLLSCGSFGNLECLSLAFTHVTSACAHQLIKLPALRYLNLWATQFGDAGLIVIAEHLDKLQVLNLCETPVSDKGIVAIAAMRSLKKLNLNSTKLSSQTLDLLKQKLPTLQELDVRYTDAW